ncbi:MAG: hypothetical protein IMF02_12310, partial [Proteobacteria bacterium]|nr:hypothetical protein [Pseudomonadota bacterium]
MRVAKELKAIPHENGHRIDLSWKNPTDEEWFETPFSQSQFAGVRVVRKEQIFPANENDGDILTDPSFKKECFSDTGLKGQTVYYYTIFTFDDAHKFYSDRNSRISAIATTNYGTSEKLYSLLPAIYHRYDKLTQDQSNKGELQRFLEIFGPQLDFIKSYISSGKDLMDINRVAGNLLSLLAQWIGWQTNPALDLDSQRNEIRFAPHFYRTIGIAANLRALVNRLTNWDCHIKEFHHNVFRTNAPPELALWMQKKTSDGWQPGEPFILDTAYDGAPSILRDSDETDWLFYHVHKDKSSDIGCKCTNFEIADDTRGNFSDIWYKCTNFVIIDEALKKLRIEGLPEDILIKLKTITDKPYAGKVKFLEILQGTIGEDQTNQYQSIILKYARRWQPSKRLTNGKGLHKYPAVVQTGDGVIHLFWSSREDGFWHIKTAKYRDNEWKDSTTLFKTEASDIEPTVCSDPNTSDKMWLFWSSLRNGRWQIWQSHYYNNKSWTDPKPLTTDIVYDRKPSAIFIKLNAGERKLWVFWSRKTDEGWRLYYYLKDLNPVASKKAEEPEELIDLSCEAPCDDTEPYALYDGDGKIHLFWRSNRITGADNIWYSCCNIWPSNWQEAQQITYGADSCQSPAVIFWSENNIWLWYRSSRSIEYISKVFPNTVTLDHRYSGATTVDTRNPERWNRKGFWEDNQTYTYDTGKDESNWYARDTIGLYLTPETENQQLITRSQELVKGILNRFLPVQLRAVFIINPAVYPEYIYTYDHPDPGMRKERIIEE